MGEAEKLKSSRPLSRAIVGFGVLLLGVVAASRLSLSYEPDVAYPELTVSLGVPGSPGPDEVSRRWVVPAEAALRGLGDLEGMAGQVSAGGARLRARFASGVDAEQKAARLDAELGRLRRRMPAGGWLSVWPSSEEGGERVALLWLESQVPGEAAEIAERMEGLPGVRAVDVFGEDREELRVRLRPEATVSAEAVRAAIHHALGGGYLGHLESGGRQRAMRLLGASEGLERLPIQVGSTALPLSSLAFVEEVRVPPWRKARFEGRGGRALLVRKENDADMLAVDRAVARWVAGEERIVFVRREADPLRELLHRLAWGWLGAVAIGCLTGFWLGGLRRAWAAAMAPLLLLSLSLNLLWLAGLDLDVTTLLALQLGVAAGLIWIALSWAAGASRPAHWLAAISAMASLPVAVALAGGWLGPLLARPALTFLLAGLASYPVAALLGPVAPALPRAGMGGALRALLRDPLTVLLVFVTAVALSIGILGPFFEPRSGSLEPRPEELTVNVSLAEGSTLETAEREIEEVEKALARMPPVLSSWSYFDRGGGVVVGVLDEADRDRSRREAMVTRLRYSLPRGGASFDVALGGGGLARGGKLSFDSGLEERAHADEDGREVRVILRGTNQRALERAWHRLRERADRLQGMSSSDIRPDWGAPAIRVELEPRSAALPSQLTSLADRLYERSSQPPSRSLPGRRERNLRVAAADQPLTDQLEDVPTRQELLARPLRVADSVIVPAALASPVERPVYPELARQSGRFVLPVSMRCTMRSNSGCKKRLVRLQQTLSTLPLPPSVDLELPELSAFRWWKEKWRMLLLAMVLPGLLLTVALVRLDSLPLALATLGVPAAGVALAAPAVAQKGWLDELGLLALAAALTGGFALAMESVEACSRGARRGGPGIYRVLSQRTPWLLYGLCPVLALVGLPVLGAGTESAWSGALRIAVLAFVGSAVAASTAVPALVQAAIVWQARDRERDTRVRHPPQWIQPGPPVLAVRNLNKTYRSGFCALHSASFELEPGIVGLLGPNGAGKTTLLRLATGLLEPTRGQVLYRGVPISPRNLPEYRRHIGFLPQDFNAYPGFSAREFLEYWALEKGIANRAERQVQIEELLDLVRLGDHADRKVRDFSGGMRRRMGIAQSLLGNPPLLVIDEPTTGLDIEARQRLRRALLEIAKDRVVLFSTHIASDVEAVATRILILLRGRLRFDGSVTELLARARGRVFEVIVDEREVRGLGRRFRVTSRVRLREGIRIRGVVRPGEEAIGTLVSPSLEEAYLAETDLWSGDRNPSSRLAFLDVPTGQAPSSW